MFLNKQKLFNFRLGFSCMSLKSSSFVSVGKKCGSYFLWKSLSKMLFTSLERIFWISFYEKIIFILNFGLDQRNLRFSAFFSGMLNKTAFSVPAGQLGADNFLKKKLFYNYCQNTSRRLLTGMPKLHTTSPNDFYEEN